MWRRDKQKSHRLQKWHRLKPSLLARPRYLLFNGRFCGAPRLLVFLLFLLGTSLLLLLINLFNDAFGTNRLPPLFLVPIKTFLDHSGKRANPKEAPTAATIAIVSVLDSAAALSEFQLALSTVRCYCQRSPERYAHFVLFSPPSPTTSTVQDKCDLIGDFMFRRHCVMSAWLAKHPSYEWILFLDADMAVVNPFHDVEEFVTDSGIELVLLERMFNFEIMAGSYLAKNTPFATNFLLSWANYFYRLPKSYHGTDNGAIHALMMDNFADVNSKNACQHLWDVSRNDATLFIFEACTRFHTNRRKDKNGTFEGGKVKLLAKGQGWVRDGGHTESKFSSRDFMLHGWKNSTFNQSAFNPWTNPFGDGQRFDSPKQCAANESTTAWKYRDGFLVSEESIGKVLDGIIRRTREEYENTLRKLNLTN
uniref:Uncharacterized protein n=1 Tax=Globodera rostochiensis TaxID=31243 RepID=A0A914GV83_GLORO